MVCSGRTNRVFAGLVFRDPALDGLGYGKLMDTVPVVTNNRVNQKKQLMIREILSNLLKCTRCSSGRRNHTSEAPSVKNGPKEKRSVLFRQGLRFGR